MYQCLILAAGLGTRLKPITDTIPKALVAVDGVPLLERQIKQLAAQGVTRFVVNVHHFADRVEEFLHHHHNFGYDIAISDERNLLLDTGGAVKKALPLFDAAAPVLIYNVDIVADINLSELYLDFQNNKSLATLVVSERASSRCFLFNSSLQLCGWRNAQTGEEKLPVSTSEPLVPLAFGGIHLVSPRMQSCMSGFPKKFSIVDFYLSMAGQERILAHNVGKLPLLDVGKMATLQSFNDCRRYSVL